MASGSTNFFINILGLGSGSVEQRLRRAMRVFLVTALLVGATTVGWLVYSNYQFGNASALAQTASRLHTVNGALFEADNHYREYLKDGDAAELAAARESIDRASSESVALQEFVSDKDLLPASDVASLVSTTQAFNRVLDSGETGAAALDAGFSQTREASVSIQAMVRTMLDTNVGKGVEGMGAFRLLTVPLLIFAAGAIIYAIVAGRVLQQQVVKPLTEVTAIWHKIIQRERLEEIPYADRSDEIGDQARAIRYFHEGVIEYDEMRAKREKQREEHDKRIRELADKFEKHVADVVSGVAAASSQLQNTAESMASTAEQSSIQTSDVSNSLGEASAGVTAAAAACDEFAMSIGEISRQASTSAELARTATAAAASADTTISALSDSALQVGKIVEMISTIAQRTNLLALNASIEAARGGEAGRGFAVVAAEVKELATQTGKATDEVAAQIRSIQDTTGASVDALRSIADQIKQLESTAVSIAAAVDQQSVAGQDLARSIDRAARSTEDVSASIGQVRETSFATGSDANQVLTSSTELEQQAGVLREQVGEFLNHVRAA